MPTKYKNYFKDKKITIMGLGLLGRGLGDTIFLAECGAKLTVTDLKPSTELRSSLEKLRKYKGIKYTLGGHDFRDFKNRDMILKAAGIPALSPYIKEAKRNKIPVEMDASLFAKLAVGVKIIGITGTRGKSITTEIIYQILKANYPSTTLRAKKPKVYLGGNVRGVATLPLLRKVKPGDIVVCELDSWQLQGFGETKISPQIAVFTSFMPDHMNYYGGSMKKYFADKANIFKYQTKGDTLVIRPGVKKLIPRNIKARLIVADPKKVKKWKFSMPGVHHRENLAAAVAVAKAVGIAESKIKSSVSKFISLEGRLQLLKNYKGILIYNDNNSTTPEATIAGIEAIGRKKKNIVLILGGADKNLPLENLTKTVNKNVKSLITIPGNGTERFLGGKIKVEHYEAENLKEAVKVSLQIAEKGDQILFSPGFASFSQYKNEYERGDEFVKLIKRLK